MRRCWRSTTAVSSRLLISKRRFNANTVRAAACARFAGPERKALFISATIRTTRTSTTSAPAVKPQSTPSPVRAAATRPASGAPAVRLGRGPIEILGKFYFKTREGKLEELPSDISYEEAVNLEVEAKAAEAKVGKGPAPQPVPDVKKLVKQEPPKKPKAAGKGTRTGGGKGKAAAKGGAAAASMLKAVGKSKVAQYLAAKAAPVLQKRFGKLQKLSQNEQTHDDAAAKREQSEKAEVIPVSDGQSKSNASQVNTVTDRPAPAVDEAKGKKKLQDSLRENVPRKIEDVDNFQRDQKGKHIGSDVMGVVLQDKNAVVSTYQDVGQTPPPAPREHEPEDLPPQEVAPGTATMNLGQDAIAPLQKDHTDVSNFTKDADKKLGEEGVTQEQLDMVDSGDLASANKEKKGMEATAKSEPLAIQQFAQQQSANVDKDLKQEENKQRTAMKGKRKSGLNATTQKQKKAKSDLEKKREEVAAKINGIYTTAQDRVKKRLADLETESMKRFDDGNAKATKKFEDDVNRELDAFKEDRYSGWFGWARKLRDWIKGMDDLPAVKAIFDRNREVFVATINKLVEDISADNKRVIQECKDELQNARKEIAEFVKNLKPNLTDIGKQAAEEMNSKLNEMDKFIAKKEEDLQNQLKDKQTAAIKAIDEKIEKMKEAMAGALAKLGKLLLWAAKKFFTWALEKFGFSLSDIQSIIDKGVAVLKAIFTKPIAFVKSLIGAAKLGFNNFKENFLTHLKDAVFEWLTGSLEGVKLPSTWDPKGIASVIFQLVDISKESILKHVEKYVPAPLMKALHTVVPMVQTLIEKGPMAVWEQLKESAAEMTDAFVETVKDWIKWTVVRKAVETVLAMFVPGAGIIRAIIGIYDTVVFFIQKAKEIMKMIGNFLGSISEIAAGNIGAAAKALEDGLARGLKLVIEFLARFLKLTGITRAIRDALTKIRGKVHGVLDKVAKWIADKAKKLWGGVKATAGKVMAWWKARRPFKIGNESHELYVEGEQKSAKLMVKSTPQTLENVIGTLSSTGLTEDKKKIVRKIKDAAGKIDKLKDDKGGSFGQSDGETIMGLLTEIAENLALVGLKAVPPSNIKFKPRACLGGPVGFEMIADPLTLHPGGKAGSQPHQESKLWKAVNQRERTYVQGHLLNHHVHGPGVIDNMVPITISANTRMETQGETRIKKAVIADNLVIRYTVKTEGKQSTRKYVPAEGELPAKLILNAYELGDDGKKKAGAKPLLDNFPVENTLGNDLPVGIVRPEVNLSGDPIDKLQTIPGIGPTLAERILKLRRKLKRPFHVYEDLEGADGIGDETVKELRKDPKVKLY
ncbi:MAG TPA: helix-hairpin-helix domain-containing protein [Pyrinomonadaceae bacterium]|nr:helix-hairpin-helix domain-containing protein [Pyrinomonadaceae bacterium]